MQWSLRELNGNDANFRENSLVMCISRDRYSLDLYMGILRYIVWKVKRLFPAVWLSNFFWPDDAWESGEYPFVIVVYSFLTYLTAAGVTMQSYE